MCLVDSNINSCRPFLFSSLTLIMKFLILAFFPLVWGLTNHVCPGGKDTCPDTSTCCELLDKSYGCCPLKNAICCDDHIHCCPSNFKCATGMCIQNSNISTNVHLIQNNDVVCPGEKYTCPEDTTCCQVPGSSEYGCCPMEDAVCCADGVHCCPFGSTCDLEQQRCNGDKFHTPMYDSHKRNLLPLISDMKPILLHDGSNNVICPGSEFQCPDSYTCCQLPSKDWGCCPFSKASCCNDGLHCCPEHMRCDPSSRYCTREGMRNVTSHWNKRAERIENISNVCPDAKTHCSSTDTCCKVSETQFGCCHYSNATCCKDFRHCCPSGNLCDIIGRRCVPEGHWMLNLV